MLYVAWPRYEAPGLCGTGVQSRGGGDCAPLLPTCSAQPGKQGQAGLLLQHWLGACYALSSHVSLAKETAGWHKAPALPQWFACSVQGSSLVASTCFMAVLWVQRSPRG